MRNIKYKYSLLIIIVTLFCSSCKKFVTIPPPSTQLVSEAVYDDDATATAVLTGLYSKMIQNGVASGDNMSITLLCGLSADELKNYSAGATQGEFYLNALSPSNSNIQNIWSLSYKFIYSANAVLAGLNQSSGVSPAVKNELTGEAKFIRAFFHFYLVNLFGDVPLVLSTDYATNTNITRTSRNEMYKQIIQDLQDAKQLLLPDYSFSNGERVRPNKYAAGALLSRVYLFTNEWQNAADEASYIINTGYFQLEADLNNVFLINSSEAIWQLEPVKPTLNTNEGYNFILTGPPTNVSMTTSLQSSFEQGDLRKINWTNSLITTNDTFYYPYKYKVKISEDLSEYSMVLRLSELYLIRSESRAHLSDFQGASDDLNIIRNRAGLSNSTAFTQLDLLSAIQHENQVELFCEWGHRWLDLKRTGTADSILSASKAGNWSATDSLYPIPTTQLQNDPAMSQNPGY
jgi:starch-binding outer membrane protein, SusD/RagB family